MKAIYEEVNYTSKELKSFPLLASVEFRISPDGHIVTSMGCTQLAELFERTSDHPDGVKKIFMKYLKEPMVEAGKELEKMNSEVIMQFISTFINLFSKGDCDA